MFPELQSPTSPDDQPMNEPKIPSTTSPTSYVADNQLQSCPLDVGKSSGTLKNNIDLKDQANKKRTSLHIENSSTATTTTSSITHNIAPTTDRTSQRWSGISNGDDTKEVTSITMDFAINLDNAVRTDNNNEVYSDCDNNGCGTGILTTSIDDNNLIDTNRYESSSWHKVTDDNNKVNDTGNYIETEEEDDDEADYNDMEEENGNSTDSTRKRDSVTSRESSDDYFLCEKFKNTLNTNLQNALNDSGKMAALELLSPHEGPLGRRYAEIAHFKTPNTR